jgi:hypothetical protein
MPLQPPTEGIERAIEEAGAAAGTKDLCCSLVSDCLPLAPTRARADKCRVRKPRRRCCASLRLGLPPGSGFA